MSVGGAEVVVGCVSLENIFGIYVLLFFFRFMSVSLKLLGV